MRDPVIPLKPEVVVRLPMDLGARSVANKSCATAVSGLADREPNR
jgi:hypothetical protein